MAQLGRGPRFAEEEFAFGAREPAATRHLERDDAVKLGVAGFPDGAKCAGAEAIHEFEAADRFERLGDVGHLLAIDEAEDAAAGTAIDRFIG